VAQVTGISTLRDGSVSVVLHVPHEIAEQAFLLHPLQYKPVRVMIKEIQA